MYLVSPADFFAGADDITKERGPGIEISTQYTIKYWHNQKNCQVRQLVHFIHWPEIYQLDKGRCSLNNRGLMVKHCGVYLKLSLAFGVWCLIEKICLLGCIHS